MRGNDSVIPSALLRTGYEPREEPALSNVEWDLATAAAQILHFVQDDKKGRTN